MNLNFKSFSILLAGAALGLTACTDDNLQDNGMQAYDGNYFHVKAGIALPTAGGTRSQTDDLYDDEGNPVTGNGQTNSTGSTTNGSKVEGDGTTTPDDYEYGYGYENEIRTMILVFTNPDYKYVAHSRVNGITNSPADNVRYDLTVKAELKTEDLEKAYGPGGALSGDGDKIVHVFAFCNPPFELINKFENEDKTDWINWVGRVEEAGADVGVKPVIQNTIWAERSFFMSNAKIATIEFPEDIAAWGDYADKEHPFILNQSADQDADPDPIYVERAAARIDFRDGSPADTDANTYPIMLDTNGNGKVDDGDTNVFSIHLNRMCLVNMSKDYYYLRRVSDGTDDTGVLCGPETSVDGKYPYVVDTDWADKRKPGEIKRSNAAQHFNFTFFSAEDGDISEEDKANGVQDDSYYNRLGWYVDRISDVLDGGRQDDTWSGSTNGRYKIWRYVTENTIPLTADGKTSQQKNIQSTGIVFKGAIVPGDDIDTDEAKKHMSEATIDAIKQINGDDRDNYGPTAPKLFSFENRLYAGVKDVIQHAENEGQGSSLYNAVSNVLSNWYTTDNGKTYKYGATPDTPESQKLYAKTANSIITNEGGNYTGVVIEGIHNDDNESDINFIKHAPESDIAIYRPFNEDDGDGWGYYCYYVYWNRHNDNLKSGLMGKNEFATVRNNVYKLAVTGINQIGHPRVKDYDPDPFDPEDPDEDSTNYLQVDVQVLPWVVRVNNIEF